MSLNHPLIIGPELAKAMIELQTSIATDVTIERAIQFLKNYNNEFLTKIDYSTFVMAFKQAIENPRCVKKLFIENEIQVVKGLFYGMYPKDLHHRTEKIWTSSLNLLIQGKSELEVLKLIHRPFYLISGNEFCYSFVAHYYFFGCIEYAYYLKGQSNDNSTIKNTSNYSLSDFTDLTTRDIELFFQDALTESWRHANMKKHREVISALVSKNLIRRDDADGYAVTYKTIYSVIGNELSINFGKKADRLEKGPVFCLIEKSSLMSKYVKMLNSRS